MTPPILGIWASQISGHLWAPAGAYDALATVTVPSGGVASVTFAGIPTGYKHLQIRGVVSNAYGSGNSNVSMYLNGDTTTSNYYSHYLYGVGSGSGGAAASANSLYTFQASGQSTYPSAFVFDLLDYSDVAKYKTTRTLSGYDANGSGLIALTSALWKNTAAVTSLQLVAQDGNWNSGSTFALYGVK
jgi:hypothetical protein